MITLHFHLQPQYKYELFRIIDYHAPFDQGLVIIISDIYPGSSTHSKVFSREVLHWIELEFGNVVLVRRGENRIIRRKTSRSRVKNQQPT